jgi:hypothetical protein
VTVFGAYGHLLRSEACDPAWQLPSVIPSRRPTTTPSQSPTSPTEAPSKAPTTAPTQLSGSLYFTGTGAVSIADNTAFPSGSSDYTIEAWIKPTRVDGKYGIVGWGAFSAAGSATALRFISGGYLYHYWYSNDLSATTQTSLSNGAWHHVAATANSTTRAIWVNGTMIAFDTPSSSAHVVVSPVTNTYLGMTYASPLEYFYGWMDEVRVWSYARTGAQLRSGMYTQLASSTSGLVGQWHFDEG